MVKLIREEKRSCSYVERIYREVFKEFLEENFDDSTIYFNARLGSLKSRITGRTVELDMYSPYGIAIEYKISNELHSKNDICKQSGIFLLEIDKETIREIGDDKENISNYLIPKLSSFVDEVKTRRKFLI